MTQNINVPGMCRELKTRNKTIQPLKGDDVRVDVEMDGKTLSGMM